MNDQNTEKSPGNLRRPAVTQTPVRNHQLILIGRTIRDEIMIIIDTSGREVDPLILSKKFKLDHKNK